MEASFCSFTVLIISVLIDFFYQRFDLLFTACLHMIV